MPFTGKATFTAGPSLPEIAEDVADLVGIVSPFETPLLDALGDPHRAASSTHHEWLEDALLPNTDAIAHPDLADPDAAVAAFTVATVGRFRVGDQVQPAGSREVMLVTATNALTGEITVVRGYGSSPAVSLGDTQALRILGNAALEGDDAPAARFTTRVRKGNYTQIFSSTVQVSGSELAVKQLAVDDEMDYQKQLRLRELLRDLENCVINGVGPAATPQGSASVRRTMTGLIPGIVTHTFVPGAADFPADMALTEAQLNQALRTIWESASSKVDLIVVGGAQKRRINGFIASNQRFSTGTENYKNLVSSYESDFGVCRVILSRYVPADTVLLLDSSRLSVLPLAGRSFQFKPLAPTGDYESGELLGEYTLELRNESAHGVIRGLRS